MAAFKLPNMQSLNMDSGRDVYTQHQLCLPGYFTNESWENTSDAAHRWEGREHAYFPFGIGHKERFTSAWIYYLNTIYMIYSYKKQVIDPISESEIAPGAQWVKATHLY